MEVKKGDRVRDTVSGNTYTVTSLCRVDLGSRVETWARVKDAWGNRIMVNTESLKK